MKVYAHQGGAWRIVYNRSFTFSPPAISVDENDYNLITKATAAGWNGTDPLIATVTVNGGVVIGSSTLGAAFAIGSLPAGSSVILTNNGYIEGKGGTGGTGGTLAHGAGFDGTSGGLALSIGYATTVVNNGVIGGGGGGGGGASTASDGDSGGDGGGGGQGRNGGPGGAPGAGRFTTGVVGTDSTYLSQGFGHHGAGFGDGGTLGVAGDHGNSDDSDGGNGGAAGACTSGYANVISWTGSGSTYGALN